MNTTFLPPACCFLEFRIKSAKKSKSESRNQNSSIPNQPTNTYLLTMINTRDDMVRRRLQAFIDTERRRKVEVAVVGVLWLAGCPILSSLPSTKGDTLYGEPDEYMCGLNSYSASASMSSLIPKTFGSIFATLFAVLVVQRTVNGMCPVLKLGWLRRFSSLVPGPNGESDRLKITDIETYNLALQLYRYIEWIELLGYITGFFLVALVACDAKEFTFLHVAFSTTAFCALLLQNFLIGRLERKFPSVFPTTWTSSHANRAYALAIFHNAILYFLMFWWFGPIRHFNRCDEFLDILDNASTRFIGNADTGRFLFSVAMWYNEYCFGAICIYIQLLEHYETQMWDFVGESNMIFATTLSRFSFATLIDSYLGIFMDKQSQIQLFLGLEEPQVRKMKNNEDKMKEN